MNSKIIDLISSMRNTSLQQCKDRIEAACKQAADKCKKEEYGITSKRKRDFLF